MDTENIHTFGLSVHTHTHTHTHTYTRIYIKDILPFVTPWDESGGNATFF